MKIYHYCPQTCEFLFAGVADESPLQAGVYLIPAHATQIQPPSVAAREVAVFDEELQVWSVQPDWRGVALYYRETGERMADIRLIGQIELSYLTEVAPTVPLPCAFVDQTWVADKTALAQRVRFERDGLLAACDWTVLPDAPLTAEQQQAWRNYRQQLRDLPHVASWPFEVQWPTQPV